MSVFLSSFSSKIDRIASRIPLLTKVCIKLLSSLESYCFSLKKRNNKYEYLLNVMHSQEINNNKKYLPNIIL